MISFQGVEKSYGWLPGRRDAALSGLDLRVRRGECVALIGPNGAGKSTVVGLALGFLRPSAGRIRVGGTSPVRYLRERGAAYLPERFSPSPRLRAEEVLRRLALLEGVERDSVAERVRVVLDRVGMGPRDGGTRVRDLSRGYRQRLGIAQLLLARREVFLLDEPWGGLDPEGKSRLRRVVSRVRGEVREAAVIVCSHDLVQVARVADRAVILDEGRAVERAPLRGRAAADLLERRVLARAGAGPGGGA